MGNHTTSIDQHLLLEPDAPRSICSEPLLRQSNWYPIKRIPLTPDMLPFRFAGHPIHAMYAVCPIAELTDCSDNVHQFKQDTYLLPPTPISFLVGLQLQLTLSFDHCLRTNTDSHLKLNAWNSINQLMVNSHFWLPLRAVNTEVEHGFDWDLLIKAAFRIPACDDTSSHLDSLFSAHTLRPPSHTPQPTLFHHRNGTIGAQYSP